MKTLLFPILSIIAAIGLYFFFISPQLAQINELGLKEEEFTQSLSDVREIEGIIGRLASTYAGITQGDLQKLERFLPREFDQVRVVRDLYTLTERENVEITAVTVSDPSENRVDNSEPILQEHTATIDFFAGYEDFKDILGDIETNLQIARVDAVTFTPPKEESGDSLGLGLSSYSIMLTFYSFNNTEG